ncbi:MAG TPA: WxL domain-containing protein [Solirubrobacteraceae bacterium]|jgi:hypothetical protein|nr:WxL domain-containing protein [Solirubrobacteraceae bacterium]
MPRPHLAASSPTTAAARRRGTRLLLVCSLGALATALGAPAPAAGAGSLTFAKVPALPTLTAVTLNAKSQTVTTAMTNFAVSDTRGTKSGWNVTVAGQSGVGKSAVFARYCPKAKCASDAEGYVAGGAKMAAGSLTLASTGAKLTGGSGSAPTLQCAVACALDSAAPVKILSGAAGAELTWTTSGFSATSLSLAVPTTLRALATEEVYRVDLLWTLATGP